MLRELVRAKCVVIATKAGDLQKKVLHVSALVDKAPAVKLDERNSKPRPAGQQVVVLFQGAASRARHS